MLTQPKTQTGRRPLAIVLFCSALPLGCQSPYEPPTDSGSEDCIDGLDDCHEGEAGDDEVGDTGPEEPEELAEGECVFNHNPDVVGYRHQCEGSVDYQIEFDIDSVLYQGTENCEDMEALIPDGQLCTESHDFGSEPYEQAQVAACCGTWDEDPELEDDYLAACAIDLANQSCLMLRDRLQHHLDWNHFAGFEWQAENLIAALTYDIGACTGEIIDHDSDPDPEHLDSYFDFPNNSTNWPIFDDFTMFIDIGVITGFEPGNLECSGIQGNDGFVFPKPQADIGGTSYPDKLLTSSMNTSIDGPEVLGYTVTGGETMTSVASSCSAPWCSNAAFSINVTSGDYSIDKMELFASSDVTLSNRLGSYDLDAVRVYLGDVALGYINYGAGTTYKVDAGDAWFWLVGGDNDDPTRIERIHAVNATDIVATFNSGTGVWSLASFEIEYTDLNSDTWAITIPASTWDD